MAFWKKSEDPWDQNREIEKKNHCRRIKKCYRLLGLARRKKPRLPPIVHGVDSQCCREIYTETPDEMVRQGLLG